MAYFTAIGEDVDYVKCVTVQEKVKFNEKVRGLLNRYNMVLDEAPFLVLFTFLHNPGKVESLEEYSSIDSVFRFAGKYQDWRKMYQKEIHDEGLYEALFSTIPSEDFNAFVSSELYSQLAEAF